MDAELRRRFLRTWGEWDAASSHVADRKKHSAHMTNETLRREAAAMERAAGDVAASLGFHTSPFRSLLGAWRAAGYERGEALRAVEVAVADHRGRQADGTAGGAGGTLGRE